MYAELAAATNSHLPSFLPAAACTVRMRTAVSSQAAGAAEGPGVSERGKNNHTNKAVTANKRSESGRASERGFAGRRRQPRKGGRKAAIRWISEEGGFSLPSLGRTESAAKRIGKTTKSVFSASAISTRSEERRRRRPLPLITTRRLRHFSRVFAPFLPRKITQPPKAVI